MYLDFLGQVGFDGNVPLGNWIFGKLPLAKLKNKNVIIWGTSIKAELLRLYLEKNGIVVYAYCNSNVSLCGNRNNDIKILSPEQSFLIKNLYYISTVSGGGVEMRLLGY